MKTKKEGSNEAKQKTKWGGPREKAKFVRSWVFSYKGSENKKIENKMRFSHRANLFQRFKNQNSALLLN